MPGAPTLDSEMGASREGANRGPRGQVFVRGVDNRGPRPACWLGLATAPTPPLFPPLYAAPTTNTRPAPRFAARGRISITTSCCSAVAKCISRSTENPSSLYPFSSETFG